MKGNETEIRRLRRIPSAERGFLVCLGASLLITLVALTAVWLTEPGEEGAGFVLAGASMGGGGAGGDDPVIAVLGGTGDGRSKTFEDSGVSVGWHHRISGWVWADQVIESDILGLLPRIGESDPEAPPDGSKELFPVSEWYDPEGYCVMPGPGGSSRI